MSKVILKSITCQQPSETDKDEIYLRYRTEKIWPSAKFIKIDTDQTIEINLNLDAKTVWMELELWEYDYMSRNDHLGDFVFKTSNYPGNYTCELSVMEKFEGKVQYTLEWELQR